MTLVEMHSMSSIWIKNKLLLPVKCTMFCLFLSFTQLLPAQTIVSNELIWQGNDYAAFTSLVFHKGYFYCAFRNANKHSDTKGVDCGVVQIIRSKEGDVWEDYMSFSETGFDLRDPQLSITPDNVLMLLTNKVQYKEDRVVSRQTCVSFIDDGSRNPSLIPIEFDSVLVKNWLWNIEWIKNKAYGFIYVPYFAFVESQDGVHYRIINKFDIDDMPTEASVIKKGRKKIAVVRRKTTALIGVCKNNRWEWFDTQQKVECPKLFKIRRRIYVLGRYYGETKQLALFKLDAKKHVLDFILGIPCKLDCAYPGVVYKDKVIYISYYSGDGKNSDIYFAKVKL